MFLDRHSLFLALAILPGLFYSANAKAACPGVYAGHYCYGGEPGTPGTGGNVCSLESSTEVVCNLGVHSGSYSADAKFVSPTHTTFRAYGMEQDGEQFCCEFTGLADGCSTEAITVTITGTEQPDYVDLNDTNPDPDLHLECSHANVSGAGGNDAITGSNSVYNQDSLFGGDGNDIIYGAIGDDIIVGYEADYSDDGSNDELHGGPGVDWIDGGDGSDTIYGDEGSDDLYGGDGNDDIKGGDGNDFIYGGNDTDRLCGQWGSDKVEGDDGNDDQVVGGPDVDVANHGGLGIGDVCEEENWDEHCESTESPLACPW